MAGLLVLLAVGSTQAQAPADPSAVSPLRSLARQANALPRTAATKAQRTRLRRLARHALRVSRRRPCTAVKDLASFRRTLKRVRMKRGRRYRVARRRITGLGPTSMKASARLLASRRTRRCGGGVKPTTRRVVNTRILSSNANGMRLRVNLPALRYATESGGGRIWTKLALPNTDSPGAAGRPGIPVVSSTFAVPDGARVALRIGKTSSYTIGGVEVFPRQPEPVDDEPAPNFRRAPFATKRFTLNRRAYARRGLTPSRAADVDNLGTARDLKLAALQIPAAQYNPRTDNLKVFNSVDVRISFRGGPHKFSSQLNSPWERPQQSLRNALLNRRSVLGEFPTILERCGEEMLVITNPATLGAASQFANAKRAQGMRSTVVQTGAGAGQIGTTAGEIQAFIRSRLAANRCIHPSYVTILGDDELVPTFPGINGIASDLQYSMRDDADELPDVAVGRIIGNDAAAMTTAVTKIINYENSPPGGAWLRRATIAAQFQDDNLDGQENRTFTRFAEVTRNGILNTPGGFGLSVDRIYDDSPTATPLKFDDGTDLPAAIKKPTFAWDGDGADVTAAWNEGRFLIAHRDHGWTDGWGHPYFTTANVDALTNGNQLPVVLSINCSSGAFDTDDTSFATRALVHPNGGAVGVFGDTRDSPSWHNTQIAWGFVDGLLPRVLASEGPAAKQRVGNALINGKNRLAGLAPPATDGRTRNELYLWHYFGDPSMQMWGGEPVRFPVVSDFRAVFVREAFGPGPDPPPYHVFVSLPAEFNGQAISLVRSGQVIGKAFVVNGQARIPAAFGDSQPAPGELQVAMEADGAVPVSAPVQDVKQQTSMSTNCPSSPRGSNNTMTTSGTLSPGFAGAKIVVRYDPPNGPAFERTVATDASGNWSDSIVPQEAVGGGPAADGTWTIEPRFDGDGAHTGSNGPSCSVAVFDNS